MVLPSAKCQAVSSSLLAAHLLLANPLLQALVRVDTREAEPILLLPLAVLLLLRAHWGALLGQDAVRVAVEVLLDPPRNAGAVAHGVALAEREALPRAVLGHRTLGLHALLDLEGLRQTAAMAAEAALAGHVLVLVAALEDVLRLLLETARVLLLLRVLAQLVVGRNRARRLVALLLAAQLEPARVAQRAVDVRAARLHRRVNASHVLAAGLRGAVHAVEEALVALALADDEVAVRVLLERDARGRLAEVDVVNDHGLRESDRRAAVLARVALAAEAAVDETAVGVDLDRRPEQQELHP